MELRSAAADDPARAVSSRGRAPPWVLPARGKAPTRSPSTATRSHSGGRARRREGPRRHRHYLLRPALLGQPLCGKEKKRGGDTRMKEWKLGGRRSWGRRPELATRQREPPPARTGNGRAKCPRVWGGTAQPASFDRPKSEGSRRMRSDSRQSSCGSRARLGPGGERGYSTLG